MTTSQEHVGKQIAQDDEPRVHRWVVTTHKDVHPWRRRIGLSLLAVGAGVLMYLHWSNRPAADMVERATATWLQSQKAQK